MAAAMNEGRAEFEGDAGTAETVADISEEEKAALVEEAVAEDTKEQTAPVAKEAK
jgi:hypothetical protein